MLTQFKHKIKLRVRYGETDQMGYCYYGNYAQYFEVGRVETLREIGMSYKNLEEMGIMLPVSKYSVRYKSPAKYDDELTIETTITEIQSARIEFSYTVHNASGSLVANAETTLVFVSKDTMKPIKAPEFFLEKFQKLNHNDK
jgi:acyl-CoA thioester hydrolase